MSNVLQAEFEGKIRHVRRMIKSGELDSGVKCGACRWLNSGGWAQAVAGNENMSLALLTRQKHDYRLEDEDGFMVNLRDVLMCALWLYGITANVAKENELPRSAG